MHGLVRRPAGHHHRVDRVGPVRHGRHLHHRRRPRRRAVAHRPAKRPGHRPAAPKDRKNLPERSRPRRARPDRRRGRRPRRAVSAATGPPPRTRRCRAAAAPRPPAETPDRRRCTTASGIFWLRARYSPSSRACSSCAAQQTASRVRSSRTQIEPPGHGRCESGSAERTAAAVIARPVSEKMGTGSEPDWGGLGRRLLGEVPVPIFSALGAT